MSVIFFLILIILGIFLYPIVKAYLMYRNARNQMRDIFGGYTKRSNAGATATHTKNRSKIINKDVGEYVDFEEVSTYSTSSGSTTEATTEVNYTDEQQVEDAEWEDIK